MEIIQNLKDYVMKLGKLCINMFLLYLMAVTNFIMKIG